FRGLSVTAGERLTVTIRPRSEPPVVLERGSVSIAPTSQEPVPDGPPEVLGIVQNADPSVDRFGRVVGILFSEDVDQASAENPASYAVGPTTIPMIPLPPLVDRNKVERALVQFVVLIVLI